MKYDQLPTTSLEHILRENGTTELAITHIVRVVNSHEALLEAAKNAKGILRFIRDQEKSHSFDEIVEMLEKAIAQAEGKGE